MLLRWLSGPEKAGVGGSSPSLATTPKFPTFIDLQSSSCGLGRYERASVESKWSPNSVVIRNSSFSSAGTTGATRAR